jgi:2-phospho-L-lactate transferase/gluconeogenesis factor (CofD/UPF0052 family)
MNITILSGGSGSVQLQLGLKSLYPDCKITNLINMYDDGKSTGDVRKICTCLGPSDLRKNHYVQYLTNKNVHDQNILDFYEKRFDIPKDNPKECVKNILLEWNLSIFNNAIELFFERVPKNFEFKDFSIANIVYGGVFLYYENYPNKEERAAEFFRKFLNLKDNIVINSFENLVLRAHTTKNILMDEGSIVDLNNQEIEIKDVFFYNIDLECTQSHYYFLNPKVKELILEKTDLLIFSSGTQWSSLIPTYKNTEFQNIVAEYTGKKIFVVNNEEDKDMKGINSADIIKTVSKYVDLNNAIFLFNNDANISMRIVNPSYKDSSVFYTMGNNKGKHNPELLATAIYSLYYNLKDQDIVFMDFDDTIYSRKHDYYLNFISLENAELVKRLSKHKKVVITSGNKYSHIRNRFGKHKNIDIWADGGLICYKDDLYYNHIMSISLENLIKIKAYLRMHGLGDKLTERGTGDIITCVNIKPLSDTYRKEFAKHLNVYFFNNDINCIATVTGTTSIDITPKNACKKFILDQYSFRKCLYIGDECESGNDAGISKQCDTVVNVDSIKETNLILKLLNGGY